jgi:hypothetical protein
MRTVQVLAAAIIVGAVGSYAWLHAPAAFGRVAAGQGDGFADCAQAQAAGKAPLLSGEPGYRADMDPDGDGIACDSGRR